MAMHVYKITNNLNEKSYIGITTKPLHKRWQEHVRYSRSGYGSVVHRALEKHGVDNFEITSLVECDNKQTLYALEKFWIAVFDSTAPNGYNLTSGGQGNFGYKLSQDAKDRISKAQKGRIRSAETLARYKEVQIGKKLSNLTKRRISQSMKGRPKSEETRKRMSVAQTSRFCKET